MKIMNKSQWKKIATMLLIPLMLSMNTMAKEKKEKENNTNGLGILFGVSLGIGSSFVLLRNFLQKRHSEAEKNDNEEEKTAMAKKIDSDQKLSNPLAENESAPASSETETLPAASSETENLLADDNETEDDDGISATGTPVMAEEGTSANNGSAVNPDNNTPTEVPSVEVPLPVNKSRKSSTSSSREKA